VIDGRFGLTYEPDEMLPIEEWLRPQARFAHLLRPENARLVQDIQRRVEADWRELRRRCEECVAA
jgi:pyruvate ferredoxin oxidoreductase beta subunit